MADIPQNIPGAPTGAVPPVKKETGKVQPKKETVRINLPPKPSAAPTIKLPTLPPGGPSGHMPAPGAPPAPAPRAAAPAPAMQAPRTAAAPATAPRPAAVAAPVGAATIGTLDKILVIVAMVAALIAIGSTYYLGFMVLNSNN